MLCGLSQNVGQTQAERNLRQTGKSHAHFKKPVGVECRKRKRLRRRAYHTKGPNSVWHIDGHDKLKPFGFSIHACIDGFSRRLIWLEVGPTNKDPEVIAKMYLDAVKQIIADQTMERKTVW